MRLSNYFFSIFQFREILRTIFSPNEICEGVEDINMDDLYHKGYKTVILDVDNTLVTYNNRSLSLQKINWIERLKAQGFVVFLVSNNSSKKRIERIAIESQLKGMYFALKPFVYGLKEFSDQYFIELDKTIFIGDQLFTDVLFGNWSKGYTILVEPLEKRLSLIKTLQREVELFILRKLGIYFETTHV
jgi:HAD superfamily (subfamily IIIA) phosphatase, TIGR01668